MTEEDLLEAVLNGTERIWRFSEQEQVGSSIAADRFLWLSILRAESELASSIFGGSDERSSSSPGGTAAPYRFLDLLAQPLPETFSDLISLVGNYEDRGQESIVCDAGDGFVNKVRLMRPSSLSGYLAPLANIVYHNRLFPRDRYVLENIYAAQDKYFMVLRQSRVSIALDGNGYPIKPSADMIRRAIQGLPDRLFECPLGDDDGVDATSSDGDDGIRLRFYNSDYYISDLQPGRNTVVDADTGEVHFIDPRITLNDPNGPMTSVSHLGKRREDLPGQIF